VWNGEMSNKKSNIGYMEITAILSISVGWIVFLSNIDEFNPPNVKEEPNQDVWFN
jgi:hypothetical protein